MCALPLEPPQMPVSQNPFYPPQVRALVENHAQLPDYPLLLAVWYDRDDLHQVRLLEVLEGFPEYDQHGELFSTEFQATQQFLLVPGHHLHMTLTSPSELREAAGTGNEIVKRIRQSFARGAALVVYPAEPDRGGIQALMDLLRG